MGRTCIIILRCINCAFSTLAFPEKFFIWQPFWRVWNAAGSDGRGVIGIL